MRSTRLRCASWASHNRPALARVAHTRVRAASSDRGRGGARGRARGRITRQNLNLGHKQARTLTLTEDTGGAATPAGNQSARQARSPCLGTPARAPRRSAPPRAPPRRAHPHTWSGPGLGVRLGLGLWLGLLLGLSLGVGFGARVRVKGSRILIPNPNPYALACVSPVRRGGARARWRSWRGRRPPSRRLVS